MSYVASPTSISNSIKQLQTIIMSEAEAKKALAALDVKRKALEMEADTIHSELTTEGPEGQPPMGVDTPLVDTDGYPRADIDVYRARTLRGRLKVIQTDHKALMKEIEKGLAQVAAMRVSNE
jgi:26S proteasome non-ATPase regulatory subunit 9